MGKPKQVCTTKKKEKLRNEKSLILRLMKSVELPKMEHGSITMCEKLCSKKDEQRYIRDTALETESHVMVGNHRSCLPSYKNPVWLV